MREAEVIERLRRIATAPAARGLLDDVAVLDGLVLTHDSIAEGVHFLPHDPPASVGWKLVTVNLSDLAAKGATPAGALLSLSIAGAGEWEINFLSGVEAACESYGLPLIGGDTIALPPAARDREGSWILEANLDDLSPQLVAVALDSVLAAGALDAWVAPVTMKKGRPGHLFGALVPEAARAVVEAEIFKQTSTLGIRATRIERRVLDRELVEVETAYGKVRVKVGRLSGNVLSAAPEFEDCRQAAERYRVAVKEVMAAALSAFRRTS